MKNATKTKKEGVGMHHPYIRAQGGRVREEKKNTRKSRRGRIEIKMGPFFRREVFHSCTAKTRGVRPVLSIWTFTLMSCCWGSPSALPFSTSNTPRKKQREKKTFSHLPPTQHHYYEHKKRPRATRRAAEVEPTSTKLRQNEPTGQKSTCAGGPDHPSG